MPVAGLVLTLADDDAMCDFAANILRAMDGVTVGELQRARRLPIATDADTIEAQVALWQEITKTPGVLLIDLVFEDFSDIEAGSFSSDVFDSKWKRARNSSDSNSNSNSDFSLIEEQV